MAGPWGANPDELDALANSMQRAGEGLIASSREVNVAVHSDIWRGDDAQRAKSQWDGSLRRQLQGVIDALSDCHRTLHLHAQAQRTASGATDSPSDATGAEAGVSDGGGEHWNPWAAPAEQAGNWSRGATAVGLGAYLMSYAGRVGDYSNFYRGITPSVGGNPAGVPELLRFKKSPVTQYFSRFSEYNDFFKGGAEVGKGVGKWLGFAGMGFNVFSATSDVAAGEYGKAGISVAKTVGDGLKSSRNPIAYMAGAATSAVTMAVEEGMKTDWSAEGMKATNDFAWENKMVAAEEVGKAIRGLPGMLVRVFL